MSIDHGLDSPLWMARQIIRHSRPILLVKAVEDLIDYLGALSPGGRGTSPYEVIDRLVQVASTGRYEPPVMEHFHEHEDDGLEEMGSLEIPIRDGKLPDNLEDLITEFVGRLGGLPEADPEMDLSYEEWLKKMGIPDEGDDDDDGQE